MFQWSGFLGIIPPIGSMTHSARAEARVSLVLGILSSNQILQPLLSSVYVLTVSGSQVVVLRGRTLLRPEVFLPATALDLYYYTRHVSGTRI